MLAALAPGTSTISARTTARHVNFTVSALRELGADIQFDRHDSWTVNGSAGFSPRRRCDLGRELGNHAVLPRRAGRARRPAGDDHRTALLPPPPDRPAAARAAAPRRASSTTRASRCRSPSTRAGRSGGRVRIDGTLSQWVSGLMMLAPFATRRRCDRGHRRAQRAPLPRADARDDAPVRPRGSRPRGLARVPVEPGQTPRAA